MAERTKWIGRSAAIAPLVVAAAVLGCKSEAKPKIAQPTNTQNTEAIKPLTVQANAINIDNSPLVLGLTLDQNCGILLKPGDKTTISLGDPKGLSIDFDFTLIKDSQNGLVLFSLPVEGGHSIAMVDAKGKIYPVGRSTPLGGDQVFFAFFKGREFKVKDCASDNPQIH